MKTAHLKVFALALALSSGMGIWGSDEASEAFTDTELNPQTLATLVNQQVGDLYIRTQTTRAEQPDGSVKEKRDLEVILPSCVELIAKWDFALLNPIRIRFAQDSRLNAIDTMAFYLPDDQDKTKKDKIKLNCLDFSQCQFLVESDVYLDYLPVSMLVILPVGIKKLQYAMFDHSKLKELRNIDNVVEISSRCFCECSMPRDFSFPSGLNSIGKSAFFKAKFQNASLEIPERVRSLPSLALAKTKGLKHLSGGKGLTRIEGDALYSNEGLKSLHLG